MSDDNNTQSTQDTDNTTPPTQPDTSQGKQEGTFTQADIDRIVGERVKRANESATKQLLEALGIESLDAGKQFFEAEKARKEAEMTELEKANAQVKAIQQALEAQKETTAKLEQERLNDKRDNQLLALLTNAHDASSALALLKATQADKLDSLMADGNFNSKVAETLISEFEANNAYMFASKARGTPSNAGGRAPNPDKKAKNELSAQITRIINQSS